MTIGALGYRVPPAGWKPAGWTPPAAQTSNAMITQRHVHVKKVWGIPQFWLLWAVLTMNVSAGIGVIGMASPMLQEVFAGALIGVQKTFTELGKDELTAIAIVAGGFTALISLFNIGRRFFWASPSDKLGRKLTYTVFFVLGGVLYWSIPSSATAGILGPVVVNYMREYQLGLGIPRAQVYNQTMYILIGMLVVGLIANLLVRPVAAKHFMTDAELAVEKKLAHERAAAAEVTGAVGGGSGNSGSQSSGALVAAAWLLVGIPLAWGVYRTLLSAAKFFH